MKRLALALALSTSGCTILGAVQGGQRAHHANEDRERALRRGDSDPAPERSVALGALVGGTIGAAIDAVLVWVIVTRVWTPST